MFHLVLESGSSYQQSFARESFIDEIANKANKDPYEFRRDMLSGTKDIHLLDAVADKIDWYKKTENFHKGMQLLIHMKLYSRCC